MGWDRLKSGGAGLPTVAGVSGGDRATDFLSDAGGLVHPFDSASAVPVEVADALSVVVRSGRG
eukprot:3761880-Amphidinium_carterae.1